MLNCTYAKVRLYLVLYCLVLNEQHTLVLVEDNKKASKVRRQSQRHNLLCTYQVLQKKIVLFWVYVLIIMLRRYMLTGIIHT